MRQAKVFFFVAAGVLMLAGAFALGAQTAQGQVGVSGFGFAANVNGSTYFVMTPNGDVFRREANACGFEAAPACFVGNYWGGPVPVTETTWGRIKADRR